MTEIPYTLTRGDEEIELTVEYRISRYRPATRYRPAEGGDLIALKFHRSDGRPFVLTSLEQRDLEEWVLDQHDYSGD